MRKLFIYFFSLAILFAGHTCAHAAAGHGHIRAALSTIDKIKNLAEALVSNPGDPAEVEDHARLQYLKSFFFNGNTPYDSRVKAFAEGAVLPDIINLDFIYQDSGYPHYVDTGFFYTLLIAEAAKPDKAGNINNDDIAFAMGALTHYITDKHTHPIVNEFAGNVYGKSAEHNVVQWDYKTGRAMRDTSGNIQTFSPSGGENKKLHIFLECWLVKDLLDTGGPEGVCYNNTTPQLNDDLKYYNFDDTFRMSDAQVDIIVRTYKKLWNTYRNASILKFCDNKMGFYVNAITKAHNLKVGLKRDLLQWAADVPPEVLPTSAELGRFMDDMFKAGEMPGVDYPTIRLRFNYAMDEEVPQDSIEVFKRLVPFMEDNVLDKITVNDTRLQNINLDNGLLCTNQNNKDHGTPDIYKEVNPENTMGYIANKGGFTLKEIEVKGKGVFTKSDVAVDSNPQSIIFDTTGRFAWVANKGTNTISWVDTAEDKEIDQNRSDSGITRMTVGDDPVALAISPDGSMLYSANSASKTVSVIDVAKREVKETIQVSGVAELKDIRIDPDGRYAFLSVQNPETTNSDGILSHPGILKKIDLQTKQITDFNLVNSEKPGGMTIEQDGSRIYLTDKGWKNRLGTLHDIDTADLPRSPLIEQNKFFSRLEIIDMQLFPCTVMTAPIIVNNLCGMSEPPMGIYSFIEGYDMLPAMTSDLCSLFGFGLGHYDMDWMIYMVYKHDPLMLAQGTDVDVPDVLRYTDCNTDFLVLYNTFEHTGNIGFYDRKTKEFFAATRSILGDEYEGKQFIRCTNLATSTLGDILALSTTDNKALFYPGKEIFKALSVTSDQPKEEFGRLPIDTPSSWNPKRTTVSPGVIGGLNSPVSAAIQPSVYFAESLSGTTVQGKKNGGQLDFDIFSRIKIKEVEVFLGPDHSSGKELVSNHPTTIEWAQKNDRFWELIVKDTKSDPFNCAEGAAAESFDLEFEVTLDNGAVIALIQTPAIQNLKPPPPPPWVNLELDGVSESDEEAIGGFIKLNDDDDDNDGTPDKDQVGHVSNEDDLVKITIHAVELKSDYNGPVTLKADAGGDKIKIWDTSAKVTQIPLPKIYTTPTDLPKELWVEGVKLSDAVRDVELVLEYIKDGKTYDDKVNITVGKVDMVAYRPGTLTAPGSAVSEVDEDKADNLFVAINDDNDDNGPPLQKDNRDEIIGSDDNDVVKVTLEKIKPEFSNGIVELSVDHPEALRIFKKDGKSLLSDMSVDLANPSGDLAGLATGDVDIFIEGKDVVSGEPLNDVCLKLVYKMNDKIVYKDEVHMHLTWIVLPTATIWNPYWWFFGNCGEAELEAVCNTRHFTVTTRTAAVNPGNGPQPFTIDDFFSDLVSRQIGILWVDGHGNADATTVPEIPIETFNDEAHANAAFNNYIASGFKANELAVRDGYSEKWALCITTKFIENYCSMRPHSIVFLAVCMGALPGNHEQSLIDAFTDPGKAADSFGYDQVSETPQLISDTKAIFETMGGTKPIAGVSKNYTVKEAYDRGGIDAIPAMAAHLRRGKNKVDSIRMYVPDTK